MHCVKCKINRRAYLAGYKCSGVDTGIEIPIRDWHEEHQWDPESNRPADVEFRKEPVCQPS